MAKSKYLGIDSRTIKCCCENENCAEGGISFEEEFLLFHYLEYKNILGTNHLMQVTKAMTLNKQNVDELIKALRQVRKTLH